ncbi:MAG: hypothetical protein WD314_05045 [Trueperaceae bacterium]
MAEPVILAAAAFFAVIVVGSLLVGINDWLEGRHAAAVAGGRGGLGRLRVGTSENGRQSGRPRRSPGVPSRVPLLMAANGQRRQRRARISGDWY